MVIFICLTYPNHLYSLILKMLLSLKLGLNLESRHQVLVLFHLRSCSSRQVLSINYLINQHWFQVGQKNRVTSYTFREWWFIFPFGFQGTKSTSILFVARLGKGFNPENFLFNFCHSVKKKKKNTHTHTHNL